MNTQPQTYSALQRLLDEREDFKRHVAQRALEAERMFTITQLGARAFHLALGGQGRPTLVGVA